MLSRVMNVDERTRCTKCFYEVTEQGSISCSVIVCPARMIFMQRHRTQAATATTIEPLKPETQHALQRTRP